MTVVLVVILVALLTGWARGGSLHTLAQLELPGWPLLFFALAVQAVGAFAGSPVAYVAGMVTSAGLVVVFVTRNRWLRGMPLIAFGFCLNAIVVLANGAMPVEPAALDRIGVSPAELYRGSDAKHEVLDDGTRLALLADVIAVPLPLPVGSNVVSVGDVVLAAGIGVLVTNGMLRPRRALRPVPPEPARPQTFREAWEAAEQA